MKNVLLFVCALLKVFYITLSIQLNGSDTMDDIAHVRISARSEPVTPRSTIPNYVGIDVYTGNDVYSCYVRRNNRLTLQIPVHTMEGNRIVRQYKHLAKNVGFYSDRIGSSFMITFEKNASHSVYGSFYDHNISFSIRPHEGNRSLHIVQRHPITNWDLKGLYTHDFKENDFEDLTKFWMRKKRRKRQKQLYEIELFIVVDFSIYQYWFMATKMATKMATDLERSAVSLENITRHCALLVNGIAARFSSIKRPGYVIDVILAGIYIAHDSNASDWTQLTQTPSLPRPIITEESLRLFVDWSHENKPHLSGSDHMMALTAYNLVHKGNLKTLGLAYKQSLCTERSVSIIEDHGNTAYVSYIAAHELAHSLGAKHDGMPATVRYGDQTRTCNTNGGYLMSPIATSQPSTEIADHVHSWQFSECTVLYFNFYIDYLDRNNWNCMTYRSTRLDFPRTHYDVTETSYHPDEQCERTQGFSSVMLRQRLAADPTGICKSIPCSDPAAPGTYVPILAMEGTVCGSGKVCNAGNCVVDVTHGSRYPEEYAVTDSCMFGDQPGMIADTGLSCVELIVGKTGSAHNCYQYGRHCCQTCATQKRWYASLPECEYGDRKQACSMNECKQQLCCETCAIVQNTLKECPNLLQLRNGNVATNTGTLYHGSVATFTCVAGFTLHGTGSMMCLENGTWSSAVMPACYQGCPELHTWKHSVFNLSTDNYTVGSRAYFSCTHGFVPNGATTLECLDTLTWSDKEPGCTLEFSSRPVIYIQENIEPFIKVHTFSTGIADSLYKLVKYSHPGFVVTGSGDVMLGEDGMVDYEKTHLYSLHVRAHSVVDPKITAYHTLTIIVKDTNEFRPEFTQEEYCVAIMGATRRGDVLLKVKATDADGSNNNITYTLTESTDIADMFRIEPITGDVIISNTRGMNMSIPQDRTLNVLAVDSGLPKQLTGTSLLRICFGLYCQQNGVFKETIFNTSVLFIYFVSLLYSAVIA